MTNELISTLNPVRFVPHRPDKLDEVRLLLNSGEAGVAEQALQSVTEEAIHKDALSVLSICLALVESSCWHEANQATASYLQYKPTDENAIALLAFSLASLGDFDQAHIIISRALNFLEEKQLSSPSLTPNEERYLDFKMGVFRELEALIIKGNNPAEMIFTDQETINLSILQSDYSIEDISELDARFPSLHNLPIAPDTMRDVRLQSYLQHIDPIIEQSPTEQLYKKNTFNHINDFDTQSDHTDINDSEIHSQDTMLNRVDYLDDHNNQIQEDHITEILKDVEARERQTEKIKVGLQPPSISLRIPTQNNALESIESSISSEQLISDDTSNMSGDILSHFEYLSEISDYISSDYEVPELAGGSSSESSLIIESTERMKSISKKMLEEERKRVDSILSDEDEESLVVQSFTGSSKAPEPSQIADPLLYPVDRAESRNVPPPPPRSFPSKPEPASHVKDHLSGPVTTHLNSEPHRSSKQPPPPIPIAKRAAPSIPPTHHSPASLPPIPPALTPFQAQQRSTPLNQVTTSNTRSALERLSAGELNIPQAPPPLVSSPLPTPALHQEPTPSRRMRSMNWRSPTSRSKDPLHSWVLWVIILLASYLSLMSAFHSKSAHLIHKMAMKTPNLDWAEYKIFQKDLSNTVDHPIGKTIDGLKVIIPQNTLSRRRQSLSHQLAWISTARWVFFGEYKEQNYAIQNIQAALTRAPSQEPGRAALGLAFYALGQTKAALAIIQALPKNSWYRTVSLGWIELELNHQIAGRAQLLESFKSHPLNKLTAHKLAIIDSAQGLAYIQSYLHCLKLTSNSPVTQSLYALHTVDESTRLITEELITYLKTLPPQLQRDHFDRLSVELIKREDRIGLQSLMKGLSLNEHSPNVLLLPSLLGTLSELNVDDAQKLYDLVSNRTSLGQLHINDYAKAMTFWQLFTGIKSAYSLLDFQVPTPSVVKQLGAFSGQQVAKLITSHTKPSKTTQHHIQSLLSLHQEDWVRLERITGLKPSIQTTLDQTLNHLAKAHLSATYSGAEAAFKSLDKQYTNPLSALFTHVKILHGIITSAFDPTRQSIRHMQLMDQEINIPALKWLSRFWQCQSLSRSSNLGQLQAVCLSAKQLNPRDYHSAQILAYTFLETGKLSQARILLSQIPVQALSTMGYRLKLRLDKDSHYQNQDRESDQSFVELLSAERGLRLNSFHRIIDTQLQELSRHELYRATWVAEYLGSNELFIQIVNRASDLGSLLVTLDHTRHTLFQQYALKKQKKTMTAKLSVEDIVQANSEPSTASFISLFEAMNCLAQHNKLDLHHFHPELLSDSVNATRAFKPIIKSFTPQKCRSLVTESLTQIKDNDPLTLPLVRLSQTHLLISLGYNERAERLLKDLINREPTLIEARIAYSMLLFRSSNSPNIVEIRWAMAPLLDPSQEIRRIKALKYKLQRLEAGL